MQASQSWLLVVRRSGRPVNPGSGGFDLFGSPRSSHRDFLYANYSLPLSGGSSLVAVRRSDGLRVGRSIEQV